MLVRTCRAEWQLSFLWWNCGDFSRKCHLYSKHSLIRIEIWKMKNSVHRWVYILKIHVGFRSKRTFRLCWWQKISKIGLSWMKETLNFSFWKRNKLLQWYSFNLFPSALPILLHFLRLFLLGLSFASLIRISEGLPYLEPYSYKKPPLIRAVPSLGQLRFAWARVSVTSKKDTELWTPVLSTCTRLLQAKGSHVYQWQEIYIPFRF
jgi:hypothetical protein